MPAGLAGIRGHMEAPRCFTSTPLPRVGAEVADARSARDPLHRPHNTADDQFLFVRAFYYSKALFSDVPLPVLLRDVRFTPFRAIRHSFGTLLLGIQDAKPSPVTAG